MTKGYVNRLLPWGIAAATITFLLACKHYGEKGQTDSIVANTSSSDLLLFDVNDTAFLWPVPTNEDEIANLWPASDYYPQDYYDKLQDFVNSDDRFRTDRYRESGDEVERNRKFLTLSVPEAADLTNWRVSSFRFDPCFPDLNLLQSNPAACIPQIRLVAQPIRMRFNSRINRHILQVLDFTAHLAYNLPKDVVETIVNELALIKASQIGEDGQSPTDGVPLGIHPSLGGPQAKDFQGQLKQFVDRHVSLERLAGIALMGVGTSRNNWVFVAHTIENGELVLQNVRNTESPRIMLSTLGSGARMGVFPDPQGPSLVPLKDLRDGLSDRDRNQLHVVQHPVKATVLNTDCISCHVESSITIRERILASYTGLEDQRYRIPEGVTGYTKHMREDNWNVVNFGFTGSTQARNQPSASIRVAHEVALVAAYINQRYRNSTVGPGLFCPNEELTWQCLYSETIDQRDFQGIMRHVDICLSACQLLGQPQ
ncbi:MAG: hypothetical protein HRU19_01920 [Pseudobacteriovorax sp.]|nr:hypothetical protein [Pseudobacteriovorax sp.]